MPNCFKCGEEITFNKNVLSKTGKPIPLWVDQQNTHGHDDQGNPTRGPLPAASENTTSTYKQGPRIQPQKSPQYTQETQTTGIPISLKYAEQIPTDKPSLEAILLTQINNAISTLTKTVLDIEKKVDLIYEKIEYNTQVDTNKLIGQMQIINDTIAPITKTQIKIGSELYKEQQEREQQERDEKYRKEQEQIAKWDQAKDVNAEDNANLEAMDYENQRMESE